LRALLLQMFYSIRSERQLMEQLDYNLLFRWFVGLEMDEAVWNHAVFSKNRERLLNEEVAREFFAAALAQAKEHLSSEHFTVDGRTTRHGGYAISQSRRGRIERVFGWLKTVAGIRKVKLRGLAKVGWLFQYAAAAYNLWRIPRLVSAET
jgi:IS5 family transposase